VRGSLPENGPVDTALIRNPYVALASIVLVNNRIHMPIIFCPVSVELAVVAIKLAVDELTCKSRSSSRASLVREHVRWCTSKKSVQPVLCATLSRVNVGDDAFEGAPAVGAHGRVAVDVAQSRPRRRSGKRAGAITTT
jgi:hypothetical protein